MSESRGQWSSKLGFILAATGSAIGLGNLWKFPYITYENNGGAFVLVYIACVALVGAPIMIAEILIGRKTQLNPVGAFGQMAKGRPGGKMWRGVGFLGVVSGFTILSYYSVVAGWTIHYIGLAISGKLVTLAASPELLGNYFGGEFLANGSSQILYHVLFMGLTVGAVFFGVKGGIEKVAKILLPSLFIILCGLVVYSATTSGFSEAIRFLFVPDFSTLTMNSVLEALGHAFFTLSLGMGAMLTYGSYIGRDFSLPRAALQISALDTLIALMACVVMFSIINTAGIDVSKSATILFTTIPTVLAKLPAANLINALFYMLIGFAALTSTVSLLEVVSSYAIDELGWTRHRATLTMGGVITIFGVFNALSLGGNSFLSAFNPLGKESTVGVFSTMDYLASNWFLPVGGFLIAIFTGWLLSPKLTRTELEDGHGLMKTFKGWLFLIRFVAPLAVGAIIVSVILGKEYQ
ncbi:MAG: NSS family neurotransmitter:Na+ symporter [Candidatus Krumholzibacteriia bacterium]|jgi:NSS family neurotransmitter:Na+ symporter